MGFYQFTEKQLVKSSLSEVWDFISSPSNLKEITPSYMGFDITSENLSQKMYQGMIISYKVSPLLKLKMNWVTEITHVVENQFFVDEQRLGPYKLWHHQHHIKETENGVLMTDIVTYIPPFGVLGDIANSLFIKKQLKEIFDYRRISVDNRFNQ
jgi:ligand-binding SRPBCC domain-containing protein